ncbi:myoD family inhibitor domain-containing protein [Carlito syrichta]|uniref:MyoD family inhibitor domain-containing protein n=1 Tax=Carlito syrichta TaxID=1868482 RepID=A0A3Q0DVM3_CARSF|nr:myoD family inhibitor domain-containing protein [Carlito syrichta]
MGHWAKCLLSLGKYGLNDYHQKLARLSFFRIIEIKFEFSEPSQIKLQSERLIYNRTESINFFYFRPQVYLSMSTTGPVKHSACLGPTGDLSQTSSRVSTLPAWMPPAGSGNCNWFYLIRDPPGERAAPGCGNRASPVRLWPPDPDCAGREGSRGPARVAPPPASGPPAKSSRPPRSGCDEKEQQSEKCFGSVGVVEAGKRGRGGIGPLGGELAGASWLERGGGVRGVRGAAAAAAVAATAASGLSRREAGGTRRGGRRSRQATRENCGRCPSLANFPGRRGGGGRGLERVGGGCRGRWWSPGREEEGRAAEAGGGRLGSPAQGKCDKDSIEKDITQDTNSHFTHGELQDQSIWGNPSDGELIRTQPQSLPQLQTSAQELSEEEIGQIRNGHSSLSNGNGIHHGAKHGSADNRKLSAPVSQKMHRKIQSSLSVNSDISKKNKVNAVFSQKTGSSPEDCCVHCILACLFCEFLTLCNIVLGQASCGICTSEACCCCCGDEMGDDCNCPCDMDCGIMDACCESSDCLEICMECCGICFPS